MAERKKLFERKGYTFELINGTVLVTTPYGKKEILPMDGKIYLTGEKDEEKAKQAIKEGKAIEINCKEIYISIMGQEKWCKKLHGYSIKTYDYFQRIKTWKKYNKGWDSLRPANAKKVGEIKFQAWHLQKTAEIYEKDGIYWAEWVFSGLADYSIASLEFDHKPTKKEITIASFIYDILSPKFSVDEWKEIIAWDEEIHWTEWSEDFLKNAEELKRWNIFLRGI